LTQISTNAFIALNTLINLAAKIPNISSSWFLVSTSL